MRALALLSGGLDSLLGVRVAERSGVEVQCVHFVTGFNHRRYREAVADGLERGDLPPTTVVDITADYLERVARDAALERRDPCFDCRTLMLKQADVLARERGIEVLLTGEVVGQRDRGQSHADLVRIEEAAGVVGRVARPLSAAYLPPRGLETRVGADVLRAWKRIGTLHGRSRRGQFALARSLSVAGYPTPSGRCCRLTDPRFVRRLADELQHREDARLTPEELELLAIGRHFRLGPRVKAILGRDEAESARLRAAAGRRWTFQVAGGRGSLGLILGDPVAVGFEELGTLAVRYSARRCEGSVPVEFRGPRRLRVVRSRAAEPDYLATMRV